VLWRLALAAATGNRMALAEQACRPTGPRAITPCAVCPTNFCLRLWLSIGAGGEQEQ
jgi:hypothetical protein